MPSGALRKWQASARKELDEVEDAYHAVAGLRRGRRYAAQQITHAYVVLLASQFQRFCRELHDESVQKLLRHPGLQPFEGILHVRFLEARKLDSGNPNPGNIGSDFGRFGLRFWDEIRKTSPRNERRQRALESLNGWRNAIAHQDFRAAALGGRMRVRRNEVRQWRSACDRLAMDMDRVMYAYLLQMTGHAPW